MLVVTFLRELPRGSTFQVEIPILASAKKASGKKHVKKGCGWLISCSGETRRSVVQNNPAFFKKKLEQKGKPSCSTQRVEVLRFPPSKQFVRKKLVGSERSETERSSFLINLLLERRL